MRRLVCEKRLLISFIYYQIVVALDFIFLSFRRINRKQMQLPTAGLIK